MGNPESLNMPRFLCVFHDFFGGVGSVGSPESLKWIRTQYKYNNGGTHNSYSMLNVAITHNKFADCHEQKNWNALNKTLLFGRCGKTLTTHQPYEKSIMHCETHAFDHDLNICKSSRTTQFIVKYNTSRHRKTRFLKHYLA